MTVRVASGLYAHVTWCTSRRMKAIRKYDVLAVVESVLEAGRRTGVRVHAQAVLRDHVHVLVSYLPTGYYVGSLSRDHVTATRSYIARQFGRHPDLIPV